jgi:hypothetical protein
MFFSHKKCRKTIYLAQTRNWREKIKFWKRLKFSSQLKQFVFLCKFDGAFVTIV